MCSFDRVYFNLNDTKDKHTVLYGAEVSFQLKLMIRQVANGINCNAIILNLILHIYLTTSWINGRLQTVASPLCFLWP